MWIDGGFKVTYNLRLVKIIGFFLTATEYNASNLHKFNALNTGNSWTTDLFHLRNELIEVEVH